MTSSFSFTAGGGISTADVTGGDQSGGNKTTTTATTLTFDLEKLSELTDPATAQQIQEAQSQAQAQGDTEQLTQLLAKIVAEKGVSAIKWMLGL